MHFYWVRDRVKQKHFDLFWKPGVIKLEDYFTKHHSPAHNKVIRPVHLHFPNNGKSSTRVCYSKCTSNSNKGKPIPTGGYNNTKSQSGVRTKYVPSTFGIQTRPITRHSHPRDNKAKSIRMQLFE